MEKVDNGQNGRWTMDTYVQLNWNLPLYRKEQTDNEQWTLCLVRVACTCASPRTAIRPPS